MNINEINSAFIEEIKKAIAGSSIIEALEEVLPIGKEAIYRRLRGSVIFSYPEAVLIAQKLQIPLDQMNMKKKKQQFYFEIKRPLKIFSETEYTDQIIFGIENSLEYLEEGAHLYIAGVGVPILFTQNYNYLIKFRYFKWLHENRSLEVNKKKLSEVFVSKKLTEASIVFLSQLRQINTTLILSDTMFENYLKEINHFIRLGLIEQNDIDLLKEDLHNLINEFEAIVASGRYKNGSKVSVYLTNLNIDSTFGFLDKGKTYLVFSKIFGMNYGTCIDKNIHTMFKTTYEDIKDYATLISKSGSAIRAFFFNQQHKLVDKILVIEN